MIAMDSEEQSSVTLSHGGSFLVCLQAMTDVVMNDTFPHWNYEVNMAVRVKHMQYDTISISWCKAQACIVSFPSFMTQGQYIYTV